MTASTTTLPPAQEGDPARAADEDPSSPSRAAADHRDGAVASSPFLAVIASVLTIGALKLAAPVVLPLALAVLLLALVWPLQKHLEDRLPPASSTIVAMIVLLSVLALCAVAVFAASNMIASRFPVYSDIFQEHYSTLVQWAEERDIPYEPNPIS